MIQVCRNLKFQSYKGNYQIGKKHKNEKNSVITLVFLKFLSFISTMRKNKFIQTKPIIYEAPLTVWYLYFDNFIAVVNE